jgi:thiamine-monophosphate kinase
MGRVRQNEDSLVKKFAERAGGGTSGRGASTVILGMGDDAALFRAKAGNETILTCDWFLEGTHFLRDMHPPDAVGWKCLARAVSDVAAMGGAPRCFLLSLALPETHTGRWLDHFLKGLRRAARKFRCALAGGDTTRRKEILINVMAVGEVPAGHAALRSGARVGDIIYVSGRLGEAEFGLRLLKGSKGHAKAGDPRLRKHLYPEPRLALGHWLAKNRLVNGMMDISDGLSSDLPRLCSSSGVGARVETVSVPLLGTRNLGLNLDLDPVQLALHSGDDYELLFTVSPHKARFLPKTFLGLALSAIGKVTRERRLLLVNENGSERQLLPGGWDPFRKPR